MAGGKQSILCVGPVSHTLAWKSARGCGQDYRLLELCPPYWHLATHWLQRNENSQCVKKREKSKTAKAINEQVGPGPFPTPVALEQQQNHVHVCDLLMENDLAHC